MEVMVLFPGTENLQVPLETAPPCARVITGEAVVITPAGTPPGQRDLDPPKAEQQNETGTRGQQD